MSSHFPLPKKNRTLCSDSFKWRDEWLRTQDKWSNICLPRPRLFFPYKKKNESNKHQQLLELEKEIVRELEVPWGDKHYAWKNLQIAKHKSVRWAEPTPYWFVLCDLQILSGNVYHEPEQPHAQSVFLFPNITISAPSESAQFSLWKCLSGSSAWYGCTFSTDRTSFLWICVACFALHFPCWSNNSIFFFSFQVIPSISQPIITYLLLLFFFFIQYVSVIAWVFDFRKFITITDVSLQPMYIACAPIMSICERAG